MKTSKLEYSDADGGRYVSYFATPDRPGGAAVLLAHNAPGVDDFKREVAHRLADLGYIVLCADFVGDGEVLSMNAVQSRLGSAIAETTLLRGAITARFRALLAQPSVDAGRVAAIGYCLGGAAALELARGGAGPGGGGLLPLEPSGDASGGQSDIRAKVLIQTGAADPTAPP